MTKIEYEEKMIQMLKDIKELTDEYCNMENDYLSIFIHPKGIAFNNNYWDNETKIDVVMIVEDGEETRLI